MAHSTQKFKFKLPHRMYAYNAPADFEAFISPLPEGLTLSYDENTPFDSVHWFVRTQEYIEKNHAKILELMKEGVMIWVYFPKGTSGIQTDLTRDKGWDVLMNNESIKWVSMISFNETWTTVGFRLKNDKDRKAEAKTEERLIFQYADSATKTLILPDDLAKALEEHPKENAYFDSLAFSHRREYVEWIITAKRVETRQNRIDGTIERLGKKWKNPQDRQ